MSIDYMIFLSFPPPVVNLFLIALLVGGLLMFFACLTASPKDARNGFLNSKTFLRPIYAIALYIRNLLIVLVLIAAFILVIRLIG